MIRALPRRARRVTAIMVTAIMVMLIGNTVMDTGMAVGIGVVTDTVMVAATGVVGGMAGGGACWLRTPGGWVWTCR